MKENNLRSLVTNVNGLIKAIGKTCLDVYATSVPVYMRSILENGEIQKPLTEAGGAVFSNAIDKDMFCLSICDYIESYYTGENVEDRVWLKFSPLLFEVLSGMSLLDKEQITSLVVNQFRLKSAGELSLKLVREVLEYGYAVETKYSKVGHFLTLEPLQPATMDENIRRLERYLVETVNFYFDDEEKVQLDRDKWCITFNMTNYPINLFSQYLFDALKVAGYHDPSTTNDGCSIRIHVKGDDGEFTIAISEEPNRFNVHFPDYNGELQHVDIHKDSPPDEYGEIAKQIAREVVFARLSVMDEPSTLDVANKLLGGK